MEYRVLGKKALSSVIKIEKNINILEKNIFDSSNGSETHYKNMVREVMAYIKDGHKLTVIMKEIMDGNFVWDNPVFNEIKFTQKEQDDFIVTPFQVEEGVLKCPKCGQCRTFSYSKQTRGADEPMTTFAT